MAVIIGDDAANLLRGTPGDDTIRGRGAADGLFGFGGADRLYGEAGNDTLRGGDGDDRLDGGLGADRLDGGAGNDTAVFPVPTSDDSFYELSLLPRVVANLGTGVVRWEESSQPADRLISIENITTGNGDDWVTGSAGRNVIDVGWGANRVNGGGGDDVIRGGSFAGVVYDDLGSPENATEVLRGGAGNDVIRGNGNAIEAGAIGDYLTGQDVMGGGAGQDRLVAGLYTQSLGAFGARDYDGNIMTGGGGADRFEFSDDTATLGHLYTMTAAMGGTVTDFDPDEGDKLVFAGRTLDFVGETADVGAGEWGFHRSGADTLVTFGLFVDRFEAPGESVDYLVAVEVKLSDFDGPLAAEDVLLV